MKLLIINGPNLNFLGIREPEIYGKENYEALCEMIKDHAAKKNVSVELFQSNHEGAIIDKIQEAYLNKTDGIVINPGAYTHYSYAILDALRSVDMPKVEIHISDIDSREEFRKTSVTSGGCDTLIKGRGFKGYLDAMDLIIENKVK
ncbi:MAG: type II 3-dehydroquinate dehydratase [Lachnospiraceae bacterium]|nr:type II 3-dehydroquinate dehydratase [Lachnospiraceae bacterium]